MLFRQRGLFAANVRSAASRKVGMGDLRFSASGSPPAAIRERCFAAASRAWASPTSGYRPKPMSRRLPLITTRRIQDRAPVFEVFRWRPSPSPCLPQMKSQQAGRLLVVSSITAPRGSSRRELPHGVEGRRECLRARAALELAPYGTTANTVSPGSILTEGIAQTRGDEAVKEFSRVIPAGHLGDPENVAYALLYLASDQARFVTGHDIVLDGGQILPEHQLDP